MPMARNNPQNKINRTDNLTAKKLVKATKNSPIMKTNTICKLTPSSHELQQQKCIP